MNNYYGSYYGVSHSNEPVMLGIAFLIALVGGCVIYATFLNKKNEDRFTGFVGWLYDFLSFHKLMIDTILKVLYLILACFLTLGGFFMMFSNFLAGLCMMIIGNVVLRLAYEFAMLTIIICQNTTELNKKIKAGSASDTDPSVISSDSEDTGSELPKTKICPKCGCESPGEASFCYHCGERL